MNFPFIFNTVKNFWGVKNSLKGFVDDLKPFFPENELPLNIKVMSCVTGDVTYSVETNGNIWFEKINFYFEDVKIYTKGGVLVWQKLWDILEEDEYKFFKLLNSYKNSKGIVIGAHDGTYGEWITMLDNPKNELLLIEPAEAQFNKLQRTFGKKNNVKLLNTLISCDGGEIEFYEESSGFFNSTNKSHLKNYFGENQINVVKKNSISLVELLKENFVGQLDWLHFDTESYDAKLILSLKNNRNLLPKTIVFEHNHLLIEEKYELENFLKEENYKIKIFSDNTIAFR